MKQQIERFKDLFRNKNNHRITANSFVDVHQQYDKNDFIDIWLNLINSNRNLWQEKLNDSYNGKKILIATISGGFSHRPIMNIDMILNIALKLRGANAEFLFCDHALPACMKAEYAYIKPEVIHHSKISETLCKGCYKDNLATSLQLELAHHLMSTYVTLDERQEARETAEDINYTFIKDYKINNISVGKHALSGAIRYFAHSDPIQIPLGIEITKKFLEASIITYYSTKRLLEKNNYDRVSINHGVYTPLGTIRETCEQFGVPVACWGLSYIKNRCAFTHGEILKSLLFEPNKHWENMKWSKKHEAKIMDYLNSRWDNKKDWVPIPKVNSKISFLEFATAQKMDMQKPIIGLLTNTLWEAFDYTSQVFPDILVWVQKTIAYFATRPDLQLLIRIHPAESQLNASKQLALDEIRKMFPVLPANVYIINSDNNVSTYEAMEYCDSVIIYQTQTGIELAAQGIPIIVPGDSYIRNKGIATEPTSEEEYFMELNKLPFNSRLSEDIKTRARKFAYHTFYRNLVPLSFLEETNDWRLFKPTLTKLEELLPGADKGLDILCDGLLTGSPFMYPDDEYEQGENL